jgi:hypothetical protein
MFFEHTGFFIIIIILIDKLPKDFIVSYAPNLLRRQSRHSNVVIRLVKMRKEEDIRQF